MPREQTKTERNLKALWKQTVRDYTTREEDTFISHVAESYDLAKTRGDNLERALMDYIAEEREQKRAKKKQTQPQKPPPITKEWVQKNINDSGNEDGVVYYWFPDPKGEELRLVFVDPFMPPTTQDPDLTPYYFRPAPPSEPYPAAISCIHPNEYGVLILPEGWGKWEDAVKMIVMGGEGGND